MSTIELPRIVSREEWLDARKALQIKEKELTWLRDQLAAERRALPWVKVEKEYLFDGRQGKVTLADLFEGRSQLFVKHFMMGPGCSPSPGHFPSFPTCSVCRSEGCWSR